MFTKTCRAFPWKGTSPCPKTCWQLKDWKALRQKRVWGSWWTLSWARASRAPFQHGRQCWAALGRTSSEAEGGDAPPLVGTHEECSAQFRAPQDGTDMDELERVQQWATKTKGWSTSHTSQVRQLCLFSLEKRCFRGILSTPHEKVQRRKATGSFQWSPKDGRQWAQNEPKKFHLNTRKNLFALRGLSNTGTNCPERLRGFQPQRY